MVSFDSVGYYVGISIGVLYNAERKNAVPHFLFYSATLPPDCPS